MTKAGMALPAKLTAPKVDKAVLRTRLFRLLAQARSKPVVWVGAPAGSGKTTLVASYLAHHKIKPLWYQFDVRDADPAAFFAYLRQAVGRLSRRKRETLPLLTPEYALGLPAFTLGFFEQVASRLRAPAVLVFDNFQDLPATSPLNELLPQVVKVLPEGVNLVFISRTDVPEHFAPLRAGRKLARITAGELALTTAEAREVAGHIASGDLSADQAERLNEQAGGWMAGLVLLLEGGPDAATDQAMDATVFDYFAAEIMRRAETETQAFLTQCALLPVMDARSTARLTGNARAETILRDLVRRNYFINRLPGGSMRYEFHPLFRSYLREELHRRRSAGERRAMQQKAGRILADEGEYSAAVELLSDAGAVDELVTLVLDHAEKLIAAGRHQTLTLWLQAIPQESYRSRPWLTYWLGVSRTPYDIVAAKDHFESAYAAFSAAGDVTGCYSSWSGIAECYNLMWGDFEGVDLWLEKFARLRSRYPRYPSVETEIRAQAALFGILIFLRPHHPDCAAARKTVEEMLVHAADPEFRIRALSNLALYYSWTGKFTDMHRVVDVSEAIVAQEPVSPLSRIMVKIHHGTLCWLVGRPQEVHALLGEALRIADLSGVHLLDAFVSFQYAYVHGIQDDPEAMLVALKSLKEQLSPHRRIDIAHYYFQMSWCKSLSRDYVEAQCAANDMLAILEGARAKISQYEGLAVHMPTALGRFGLAAVLVETGEYAQADGLFELGLQFSRALNSLHLEFLGLMLRAYSWLKQGDEKACRTDLERALGIAAGEHGYWTFPLWDGRKVSQVCAFALQRGIEPDYVRALIRKWRLLPPEETAAPAFWPWPVRIHTLGRLCVLVDDKEVKPSGKTREMLKAIIALGGCDVHGQRISDLLWPDAEGDQARNSFKITLHRLRKLIGPQCLLQNDGRLTLDPRLVWVDSWTFERSLTELESAAEEELGNLAAEAVHGYQTGFLPDDDAPWLRTEQERLRNRFLRVIDQAAAGLCRQKQWQAAMECYQSALDTDPLAERFYQGLMRCHHRLGQAAEGLVVYRRCQEVLAAGLGIQPSPPTESLHQQLQHLNT